MEDAFPEGAETFACYALWLTERDWASLRAAGAALSGRGLSASITGPARYRGYHSIFSTLSKMSSLPSASVTVPAASASKVRPSSVTV